MGLFDLFKKKKELPDFSYVNSIEKAKEECDKGILDRVLLIPTTFGGTEDESNMIYVPKAFKINKEGYDRIISQVAKRENANTYECIPEYKNGSVVPFKVTMIVYKDGKEFKSNSITFW